MIKGSWQSCYKILDLQRENNLFSTWELKGIQGSEATPVQR